MKITVHTIVSMLLISMAMTSKELIGTDFALDWQRMHDSKQEALEHFNEAKFGMFIHWGAYAVPAGIWKGEKIPGLGEWIFYNARIPRSEYKEMCRQFNPSKFDADAWVKLAKAAGMRYIVAMPKHHDGFAMYDSAVTDFDIMDATPFGRDPMQELYDACQRNGLHFAIYYSHATDWMDGGDAGVGEYRREHPEDQGKWASWPSNTWDPAPASFEEYLESKAKPQMRELLEKFPDLLEIWYDVPRHMSAAQSFAFYKLAYEAQPQCLINSRVGNGFGDFWIPGDNKIPEDDQGKDLPWETPGTLNNTWGFKSYDVDWKSTEELLFWILEIASKGGNYLLNIGPRADGTIPEQSIEQLNRIGNWMQINGQAIYGTSRWSVSHEGPTAVTMESTDARQKDGFHYNFTEHDFWFTQSDNVVYVSALVRPAHRTVTIRSLGKASPILDVPVKSVSLLGSSASLKWKQFDSALVIELPACLPGSTGYALSVAF